jgi:hypothetical protein
MAGGRAVRFPVDIVGDPVIYREYLGASLTVVDECGLLPEGVKE